MFDGMSCTTYGAPFGGRYPNRIVSFPARTDKMPSEASELYAWSNTDRSGLKKNFCLVFEAHAFCIGWKDPVDSNASVISHQ